MMGKYSDVTRYIASAAEVELAESQRRASLVTGEALARLGDIAFVGPDADYAQSCVNNLVMSAVSWALSPKRAVQPAADPKTVDLFGAEMASAMQHYAAARVALIVTREEKAAETRAVNGTRGAQPAYNSENPPPSRYRGVYRAGEKYRWADEVTHNGCRWWAKWDTDGRPGDGEGNGWQLTHKSLEREKARR